MTETDFERARAGEEPRRQSAQAKGDGSQSAEPAACLASSPSAFHRQHPAAAPLVFQTRSRALGPPPRPVLEGR